MFVFCVLRISDSLDRSRGDRFVVRSVRCVVGARQNCRYGNCSPMEKKPLLGKLSQGEQP